MCSLLQHPRCDHSNGCETHAPTSEVYLRALWEQILVFLITGALHGQGGTERSKSPCRCQPDLSTHPPFCPEILIFPSIFWTLPDGYFYVLGCCQVESSPRELSTESPSHGQRLWPPHLSRDHSYCLKDETPSSPRSHQHQIFLLLAFPPGAHKTFLSSSRSSLLILIKRIAPHGHLACPARVGSTPVLAFHLSAICWIPQVLGVKPGSALRPLPCSDVMVSGTVSLAASPRSGLGGTRWPLRWPTSERPRRAGDPFVNCQVLCPGSPILISNFKKNIGLLFFWLCPRACGILVPGPGIEPLPPAVEAWSLNHWTTREVL